MRLRLIALLAVLIAVVLCSGCRIYYDTANHQWLFVGDEVPLAADRVAAARASARDIPADAGFWLWLGGDPPEPIAARPPADFFMFLGWGKYTERGNWATMYSTHVSDVFTEGELRGAMYARENLARGTCQAIILAPRVWENLKGDFQDLDSMEEIIEALLDWFEWFLGP